MTRFPCPSVYPPSADAPHEGTGWSGPLHCVMTEGHGGSDPNPVHWNTGIHWRDAPEQKEQTTMTGDEHYREAEAWLQAGKTQATRISGVTMPALQVQADVAALGVHAAMAQAHATLALAAATADAALCADEGVNRYGPGENDPERRALGYGR